MSKFKFFLAFTLSVIFILQATAQDRIVQGFVTTFDSIVLIGANIKVSSTKQIVATDSTGKFSVKCSPEDVLKVTAQGFYSQKVKLTPNIKYAAINLMMKPGVKDKEFSLGYWDVSSKDKVSSIDGINNKEIDFSQYSDIYELIKGRFSGVQIINGQIIIRGIKSFYGSNEALIILDGMQIDGSTLKSISPNQVKSIDVIKDGSAAIYGSRGANGVVIIQTRKE